MSPVRRKRKKIKTPRKARRTNFTLKKINLFNFDTAFFAFTVLLVFLGLIAVADASAPQAFAVFSDPFYFARQQVVWGVLGVIAMVVCANIHYSYWRKYAFVIFVTAIFLLVAVLIPGIGSKVLGARRWISVGPATLQPSEVAKLGLAIFVARLISDKYPLSWILASVGVVVFLVMMQPDLGTTISLVTIVMTQLFVSGVALATLAGLGVLGALGGTMLILSSGYRRARLMTFLESSTDPLGTSYHMRQIILALGSGGLFGVGVGKSRQKHLFLPESATDSVFAVIAEELGFIGSAALVLLLLIFVFKCIKIASNAPDMFSKMLAVGISAWIGGQMILNLGSMVGLMPLTGIPLPFFSYGGSSLLSVLAGTGILLNISKNAK